MIDKISNILVGNNNNELINSTNKIDEKSSISSSKDNFDKINSNSDSSPNSITDNTVGEYYRSINDTTQFDSSEKENNPNKKKQVNDKELTKEEETRIKELKVRDNEVKTHEQAHVNAGATNPQYEYETGPDGVRYAVGGNAEIDTGEAGSPEANLQKAQQIIKAALAPANPSAQDRKVAAEAKSMADDARKEIQKEATKPEESKSVNKSETVEEIIPKDKTTNENENSINNENNSDIDKQLKGYANNFQSSNFVGNNINIEA